MLHEIDLEKCVEFVDDSDDAGCTPAVIERAHNQWDHTADVPDQPLFKLIVIGQRDVVLVYHHMIADGMSGYVFHREFHAALNDMAVSSEPFSDQSTILCSDPKTAQLPLEWSQTPNEAESRDKRWHPSILEIIKSQSAFILAQFFCAKHFIFSNLPSSKPYLQSVTAVADDSQRTVTSVVNCRITAPQISKLLAACRRNGTTFTPLFITMLLVVLSTDYNSKATIGSTRFAIDMRPHLPVLASELGAATENGTIFNCTSGMARASRLKKYKKLVRETSGFDIASEKGLHDIDEDKVWELTRKYKQWMTAQTDSAIRAVRSCQNMNSELEHILNRLMPFAGTVLTSTTLVSNLGAFIPGKTDNPTWSITDTQFSAAASNGAQGSQGPIFNVSGVKGGDTVVNVAFEEGVISRDEVQRILDITVARIISLAP